MGDFATNVLTPWRGQGLTRNLSTLFSTVVNPAATLQFFGKDAKMAQYDFLGQATNQAAQNTFDVLAGKQSFGAHDNWFGKGQVAGGLNQMMGGMNDSDQKAYDANQKAWSDYYAGRAAQIPRGTSGSTAAPSDPARFRKSATEEGGLLS